MKRPIVVLLGILLLFVMPACSSKCPSDSQTSVSLASETDLQAEYVISQNEETTSDSEETSPIAEQTEQPKEEEPMEQEQFYITAQGMTFTANFADNDSADAFRELLGEGDLTISMSDYGGFEKVGSIGKSLPRNDAQISTTAGDIMLYQGNQIVIFYGKNSWSYSRLGRIEDASADDLLSAFGKGDADITFSLTKPQ